MEVIKVINVSVEIPNDGVQYHPIVPRELRDQINTALMEMSATEEGAEALDTAYEWSELTPKGDDFYDPFRQVLDAAGVDIEEFMGE
jgi:phosphonate transport system substrate-binding protein